LSVMKVNDKEDVKRTAEQPAVRTTIVGGRPPGPGKGVGAVPRGIEVLVKKAAVDPEFKALLLAERSGAADAISLELSDAETAMLDGVPVEQLEAIIANTTVSPKLRPAFTGRAAAVMLAALGVGLAGCGDDDGTGPQVRGTRPDEPEVRESTENETDVGGETEKPETELEETGERTESEGRENSGNNNVTRPGKLLNTGLTGTRPDSPSEDSYVKKGRPIVSAAGPITIEGPGASSEGRTAARISSVVRRHLYAIHYWYNSELKKNPDLGDGKITFQFTISVDGSVANVTVLSSTMDSADLESIIIYHIYGWRFPPIEEGDVTVVYPFLFISTNK
jgi:outer membrane biosynthesis protein TonB